MKQYANAEKSDVISDNYLRNAVEKMDFVANGRVGDDGFRNYDPKFWKLDQRLAELTRQYQEVGDYLNSHMVSSTDREAVLLSLDRINDSISANKTLIKHLEKENPSRYSAALGDLSAWMNDSYESLYNPLEETLVVEQEKAEPRKRSNFLTRVAAGVVLGVGLAAAAIGAIDTSSVQQLRLKYEKILDAYPSVVNKPEFKEELRRYEGNGGTNWDVFLEWYFSSREPKKKEANIEPTMVPKPKEFLEAFVEEETAEDLNEPVPMDNGPKYDEATAEKIQLKAPAPIMNYPAEEVPKIDLDNVTHGYKGDKRWTVKPSAGYTEEITSDKNEGEIDFTQEDTKSQPYGLEFKLKGYNVGLTLQREDSPWSLSINYSDLGGEASQALDTEETGLSGTTTTSADRKMTSIGADIGLELFEDSKIRPKLFIGGGYGSLSQDTKSVSDHYGSFMGQQERIHSEFNSSYEESYPFARAGVELNADVLSWLSLKAGAALTYANIQGGEAEGEANGTYTWGSMTFDGGEPGQGSHEVSAEKLRSSWFIGAQADLLKLWDSVKKLKK